MSDWWEPFGRCVTDGANPNMFFPVTGESDRQRDARVARARAICQRCTVATHCRDAAVSRMEPHGVWGGVQLEYRTNSHSQHDIYTRQTDEMLLWWTVAVMQAPAPQPVTVDNVIPIRPRRPVADDPHGRCAAAAEAFA